MSTPFNPHQGLIVVMARFWGPAGDTYAQLALDTGATATLINTAKLIYVGYDPALVPDRVQMTTGSRVELVPRLALDRIEAVGQARTRFLVICHTLPPTTGVDGLLGLDFLRGQRLTIDFRRANITLK